MSTLTEFCPCCGSEDIIRPRVKGSVYSCNDCASEFETPGVKGSTIDDVPRIKDSGARRDFGTGAVRDISEGKGRCDLLPLDSVAYLYQVEPRGEILRAIERFKSIKEVNSLSHAIYRFCEAEYGDTGTMLLELSKHFEEGAKKYGDNNWKKGIPLHCYIDSAVRHLIKHFRGDTDEPHDRAFVWNLVCAIWTCENKPELDDIEKDI